MGMVFCPECNRQVSQYAISCPNCSFPIKEFMENNSLTDLDKIWICPKCAHYEYKEHHLKCDRCNCNITMKQTDLIADETFFRKEFMIWKNDGKHYEDIIARQYGDNTFDQDFSDKRRNENRIRNAKESSDIKPSTPQVTCPYCKSTNTNKISTTKRTGSILGLGILSKKIGKQWHCDNCKSDF